MFSYLPEASLRGWAVALLCSTNSAAPVYRSTRITKNIASQYIRPARTPQSGAAANPPDQQAAQYGDRGEHLSLGGGIERFLHIPQVQAQSDER